MPSIAIHSLIRPDIHDLEPYTPIVPPDVLAQRLGLPIERIVKLDANENPYGTLPVIREALATHVACSIYPDPEHTRLRDALAHYTGIPTTRIVCGAGADELIDLLLRLTVQPGNNDGVINCPPTFGMYAFDTAVCGGTCITVPRNADFSLDVAAIEAAAQSHTVRVLFLTSPNNPDGSVVSPAIIEQLVQLPLLVVVDEAYIEFSRTPRGMSHLVGTYENLVVLRTFSKWAGLAGLRIGYALLHEALAAYIWKIKQPYNVNVAAECAALLALEHHDELFDNIARIVFERERLISELQSLPYIEHVYPSQANFLLCRIVHGQALALKQTLEAQGILVRYYRTPGLDDCIRITIGNPTHINRLSDALRGYTPPTTNK